MTTIAKFILIAALSTILCRFVYASDAFEAWINSANGVRFLTPFYRRFGSIGPEDDENIILAVVLTLCALLSTLTVLSARALILKSR